MTFTAKALVATGVAGTAVAGGHVAFKEEKSKLKDRFQNQKRDRVVLSLVAGEHSGVWGAIVDEYKTSKKYERIKGLSLLDPDLGKKIREGCQKTGDSTDSSSLKTYTRGCTRITLKNHFSYMEDKKGIDDEAEWEASRKRYVDSSFLSENYQIPRNERGGFGSDIKAQDIIDFCEKISLVPYTYDRDSNYLKANKGCTEVIPVRKRRTRGNSIGAKLRRLSEDMTEKLASLLY